MRFEPSNLDAERWNAALGASRDASLLQNWEYGEAKAATSPWAVERGHLFDGARRVALVQVMLRRLPLGLGGLAWINRGPVFDTEPDGSTIDQSFAALFKYYRARGYYVRIAPPLAASFDWSSVPSATFRVTKTKGWASARLDLSRPEQELMANLRGNWRNSVRKAERSSVEVETGHHPALFERFLELHQAFITQKNFSTSLPPVFLRALQDRLPPDRKMIVLAAAQDGHLLGTVLMARIGATCEYWAGNTSGRQYGLGIGQFLLWRAIVEMKALGHTIFDLGGMDPELTPEGIYAFKAGVNADPYRLVNEIEAQRHSLRQHLVRGYVAARR